MTTSCPPPAAQRPLLSWHGWSLQLPDDWSPVKIEGDWSKGSILIADFHASRLAIRWQSAPKRKFDARAWASKAIGAEVGQLMLKESVEHTPGAPFSTGRLFNEPEPPGRDVWVGHSKVSNRLLEVVFQTKALSRTLRDQILPGINDQPADEALQWSIFDLRCTSPAGWTLKSQRLNAGDLTLSFGRKNQVLIVRQLAPARLALSRQPLEKWLDAQQQIWKKMYRVKGQITPASLDELDEDTTDGTVVKRIIHRRRRFCLVRWISKQRVTVAAHEVDRDRVVLIDAENEDQAFDTFASVGRATS